MRTPMEYVPQRFPAESAMHGMWRFAWLLLIGSMAFAQVPERVGADPSHPVPESAMSNCGSVAATVVTSANRMVTDATIELRSMTDDVVAPDTMPVSGSLELDCVPPGSYRLTARRGGAEVVEQIQVMPGPQTFVLHLNSSAGGEGGQTVSATTLALPKKAREALQKAREKIAKGDSASALRFIERALKAAPQASVAYELRGLVRLLNGRPQSAMDDLQQAIQLDPSNAQARIMMGAALNNARRYQQALLALDGARPLAPASWQENFETGRAYAGMGRLADAVRAFTRALQLNPTFMPLRLARGTVLFAAHQFSAAATDLSAYLHNAPKGVDVQGARQMLSEATAAAETRAR